MQFSEETRRVLLEMGFRSTWREGRGPTPRQFEVFVVTIDGRDVHVHGDQYQFSIEVPFAPPEYLRGVTISKGWIGTRDAGFTASVEVEFDERVSISAETDQIARNAAEMLPRGARDAFLDLQPIPYSLAVRDGWITMYVLDRDSSTDFVLGYITRSRRPERLAALARALEASES